MKGGIGPLYILWVNFRVADGKFTWDLVFRSDYLRWGSSSAGVFVYRLTLGWRIRLPSVESFLLDVRSTRTRNRPSVLVLVPMYSYSSQCARTRPSVLVHTSRRTETPKSDATLRTCNAWLLVEVVSNVRTTPNLKPSAPNLKHAAKKHKA